MKVPLVAVEEMSPEQRAQYDRFPSHLTRAILLLDGRLARALPETANALRAAALDPALREAAILRVAALQGSAYERFQHLDQARAAGWSEEQVAAVEAGRYADLPGTAPAVLRLVDAVVAGPQVEDAVVAAVRAVLDDRDLATLLVLVGHYLTVARYLAVLGVELDERPDSWSAEH